MNTEIENYFIWTLFIGIFLTYLFIKTPNIVYKNNIQVETVYDSKCFNNHSEEISCNKKNV